MAIRLSGLISGLDTDSLVKELVSAYSTKKDNYVKAQTKLSWKQDAWKEMNSKIYSFYTGKLSDWKFGTSFGSMKTTTVSDDTKASVTASGSVVNGTQTLKITQLATAGHLTGSKVTSGSAVSTSTKLSDLGVSSGTLSLTVAGEEKSINVTEEMTVAEFNSALKGAGLNANFDTTQQRFFISSAATGEDNDFSFTPGSSEELANLSALGLATEKNAVDLGEVVSGTSYATKQDAANSIIELNGAVFESSSNKISINGLTINAKGVTDGVITVTTETDVDGIYNTIKEFITTYNALINSMDAAYNATSSKGYEPLTDEEKDSMTDTEIEKWEEKIKDALLRRDSTLDSISSLLKTSMSAVYEINGTKYSLSSFGINTLGYFVSADNEKNAFHIDGDKEDSTVSNNEDKLRAAIEADPNAVGAFFNQLAAGVYDQLGTKMKSTTLKSALTVYNDKQMQNDYDDYTDKIEEWEKKVTAMEEYYYKKFSEMETALSKLQSSTSALSSLLGTSS